MLRVRVVEVWGPSFTVWGLLVRKSIIQWQMWEESPRSVSFLMRMSGMIVLNAEL